MKSYITTSFGQYEYEPIKLYYGRKVIAIDQATENLILFKKTMDKYNIPFGIIYGTLLGAVRNNNFIEYDEDTDVFVLDEYRKEFLDLLFSFRDVGFQVARYDVDLLSLIRNDDYIDIYFFKRGTLGRRICGDDTIPQSFFDVPEKINFLGQQFSTVSDYTAFLERAYGKDWRTPKKNAPAQVKGVAYYFKSPMRKCLSMVKYILRKILPGHIYQAIKKAYNRH